MGSFSEVTSPQDRATFFSPHSLVWPTCTHGSKHPANTVQCSPQGMGGLWHEQIKSRGRTSARKTRQGELNGPYRVLVAGRESWGFLQVSTQKYLWGFFVSVLKVFSMHLNMSPVIRAYTNKDSANTKCKQLQNEPAGWSEVPTASPVLTPSRALRT